MPGFVRQRLVLVMATVTRDGGESFKIGTGYFVTADLVLTAGHVVPDRGLAGLEVRTEHDGQWRSADLNPVWRDEALDAVLLRTREPLPDAAEVAWVESDFEANQAWQSSGYPDAGKIRLQDKPAWKSVGLSGELMAHGGGGQGLRELELTVDAPPPAEQWAGISGAPVFVGDRLAGFIKEAPKSFRGGRLAAVPAAQLLQNHGFRLALSPPWLESLPDGVWVLVVLSEKRGNAGLAKWVDGALANNAEEFQQAFGKRLQPKAIHVPITDALVSPGHWLRFVTTLCAAPIAIFDATDFEPAVMLALGVRAVVRRGVTLTSTADELTPTHLSELPFNIQETRLIYHGTRYKREDVRHPLLMIPAAIKSGWQELDSQPHYLDLPAYDAVRCPYPTADADGESSVKRLLVLCPFGEAHEPNWVHVSNALGLQYPDNKAARMLDMASPRLVGQALYEGIRWARTCLVDWTGWRGNVFFELGVRMACAEVGPVCVIEHGAAEAAAAPTQLSQLRSLTALLGPTPYRTTPEDEGIATALALHDAIVNQNPPALPLSRLPHDATVHTCRDAFDWKQEHITIEPHEWLRASIEAPFGKDPQAGGRSPLLFSANADYRKELDRSVKERWLAAWYYMSNRYPKERWGEQGVRATLKKLGNDVLQFGLPAPTEPLLVALRDHIFTVIDELDDLDQSQNKG